MASIRHRAVPSTSPSVTSVQQLSVALREVKDSTSAKGLSERDISECLKSAAERSQINLGSLSEKLSKNTKKIKNGKSSRRSCGSRMCLCLKVMWLACLFILALCVFVILYQPTSFYVHKVSCKVMYIILPIINYRGDVSICTDATCYDHKDDVFFRSYISYYNT